jgi:hypothetical protein
MRKLALILCALMLLSGKAFCQEEVSAEIFEELLVEKIQGRDSHPANPIFKSIVFNKADSTLRLIGKLVVNDSCDKDLPAEMTIGSYYRKEEKPLGSDDFDVFSPHDYKHFEIDANGNFDFTFKIWPNNSIQFISRVCEIARSEGRILIGYGTYEVFKLLEE